MITFRRIVSYALSHALKRADNDLKRLPGLLAEELRAHLKVHGYVIKKVPEDVGRPMTPAEMKLVGLDEADVAEHIAEEAGDDRH